MIKTLARRHRLTLLPFMLVMGSLILPLLIGHTRDNTTVPPAQVVVARAIVIEQGVRIAWLEGQAGTHPIGGYIIERERDESTIKVAHVEKITRDYVDSEGRTGDVYRIIAEDDQQPAKRSVTSEPVVAIPAKPGSAVLAASSSSVPASLPQTPTVDTKADILQDAIVQSFASFDTALTQKNTLAAREQLTALYTYQQQALSLLPDLALDKKSSLAQVCTEHLNIFEANLHVLPEQDHMDGMLVLASCNALQESAQ